MKALVLKKIGEVEYEDYPNPLMDVNNNVLVKISAVGICGSDIQGFLGNTGRRIPEMIMGHEMAGEIISILPGSQNSQQLKVGDKVVILPFINCKECDNCREGKTNFCIHPKKYYGILSDDGGMCDYISIDANHLVKLPPNTNLIHAALAEPLAVAYSAAKKMQGDTSQPILIFGAGTIGLLALCSLRALGYSRIYVCDTNTRRLKIAETLGAAEGVLPENLHDASWMDERTQGKGFAQILDAVGVPSTYASGMKAARIGATLVWVGNACKSYEISIPELVMREIAIRGSFIYNEVEIIEAISMITEGKIDFDPIIELILPMSEGKNAFNRLAVQKEDVIKTVLVNV